MATPRTTAHTLNDVARRLAPHLRILSSSQPTPPLLTHNVVALAESAVLAQRAVLALESVEHDDEHHGTVVMGTTGGEAPHSPVGIDPDGVNRELAPRIVVGAFIGAVAGALVIGSGAALVGGHGWEIVGAAAAGALLVSVFGIIWVTFADLDPSDAHRQTFVDDDATYLTLVSIHTDDPDEAAAAHDRLRKTRLRVLDVDRFGQVSGHEVHHHDVLVVPARLRGR